MLHRRRIVEQVAKLVQEVENQNFNVRKILIFGSIAKNQFHENSDLDVCVVVKDNVDFDEKDKRNLERFFYNTVEDVLDVDFVYCDDQKLENGLGVFSDIRKEGRVIYENV